MRADLLARLTALADTPLLLVASDYDGTLAPIVADPSAAKPLPQAMRAFRDLGSLPHTSTAIISGRSVGDLRTLAGDTGRAFLIGMHGAEWGDAGVQLDAEKTSLLRGILEETQRLAGSVPGTRVEEKPAGVALHYREAASDAAADLVDRAIDAIGRRQGVTVRHGKMVVEFLVVASDKGMALDRYRHRVGATAVLFIGDDATDEDAFRTLQPQDLSIKVGAGETVATQRIEDVEVVAEVLTTIASLRRRCHAAKRYVPLEECSLLSDQRTLAVISPGARVSWLCLPRVDSAAIFADLVGGDAAGFFEISREDGCPPASTRYEPDTFTLVTEWPDLTVTDYLDISNGLAFQKAGRTDFIRVVRGTAAARVRFAPRLDFGRVSTRLGLRDGGVDIDGSPDPIVLYAPGVQWSLHDEGSHQTAEAILEPKAEGWQLELRAGTANLQAAPMEEDERRRQTNSRWSAWVHTLDTPIEHAALIRRSALVLRALCHGPTGAILAAATTSLPEQLGGSRNWDYRYCWPRDAALAAAALVRLGNTGHALKFLDWILDVVDRCESPDRLRPIYTVTGGHLPPEADVSQLRGYGNSRPVRISNAAAHQVQLDVFGPIVDLTAILAERGAPIAPDHWRLVKAMVQAVEARWREPDHGIWEMRIERRHHVHSKVMCWLTVERALVVEERTRANRNPEWERLGDAIKADVLANGWSESLGAYGGCYELPHLDAASLAIGLCGLIAHDDPRWIRTVDAVAAHLRDGPTVRRYAIDDGLPGTEGGLHICTGWLVEALLSVGRRGEAEELFDGMVRLAGPTGLMTEEYDPQHRLALGNFAQAYSHLALINAAIALQGRR